jgi:succinate-acetate transporter protein
MADDTHQGNGSAGVGGLTAPAPAQAAAREELAQRLDRVTRVTLRPMASPMPIGFVGLAAATFVLASLNLGWVPTSDGRTVGLVLIAFVFPLQASASIFGVLTRDGVAATAMAILSGTWLTVGLVMLTSPLGSTSDALGVLLIVSAVCMLLPAIGACLGKLVAALVLFTAAIRFATGAVYQLTSSVTWEKITGWVGVVLFVFAVYAALAALLENVQGRTVLPMGRRQKGRMATEGGFTEQVVDVTHEPGVRSQL